MNQAEINRAMLPWSDAEFRRYAYRIALFERRGMHEDEASAIADRLVLRDQQRDDRRMCIECANLQRPGTCHAAANGLMRGVKRDMEPVKTILQRCSHFEFQAP